MMGIVGASTGRKLSKEIQTQGHLYLNLHNCFNLVGIGFSCFLFSLSSERLNLFGKQFSKLVFG